MDEPQAEEVEEEQSSREGSGLSAAIASTEGLKQQPGPQMEPSSGAAELQQQAMAQMQMQGLGIEFGLELMRHREEQLEGQLPVGPLP